MNVSLVITTCNSPAHLRLTLLAVARQNVLPGEIIVADDGSTDVTLDMLRDLAPALPCPLTHVWQPDEGFRAARGRNNAIHLATGPVVAFLDQDTLPHRNWLATHLERVGPGRICMGRVYLMSPEHTAALSDADVRDGRFEAWHSAAATRRLKRLQIKFAYYALLRRLGLGWRRRPAVGSGNLSAWRADLVRINGFDEAFVGWGQEDDDLGKRLYMAGVHAAPAVGTAFVTHLHHPSRHGEWRAGVNVGRHRRPVTAFTCERGLRDHPHPDVRVTPLG